MAASDYIPSEGERVTERRCGIVRAGTVWYADQLQLLIKWDDGASSSLRRGSRNVEFDATAVRESGLNGHNVENTNGNHEIAPDEWRRSLGLGAHPLGLERAAPREASASTITRDYPRG